MSDNKPPLFNHTITVEATMRLSEAEIGALDALVGYGPDAFLKTFYKEMGEEYLKPYEAGLRSLFDRVRASTGPALDDVRKARDALRVKPRAQGSSQ